MFSNLRPSSISERVLVCSLALSEASGHLLYSSPVRMLSYHDVYTGYVEYVNRILLGYPALACLGICSCDSVRRYATRTAAWKDSVASMQSSPACFELNAFISSSSSNLYVFCYLKFLHARILAPVRSWYEWCSAGTLHLSVVRRFRELNFSSARRESAVHTRFVV